MALVRSYRAVQLPPGWKVGSTYKDDDRRWLELVGPDQPNSERDGEFFDGGISLIIPGNEPTVELASMLVVWAFHEALEFVCDEDGRRIAEPHPTGEHGYEEDGMWTWLRDEVQRLLCEYRDRWPVVDE